MQAGLKLSGRYVLQALLGSGGMGEVWRGVDEHLDRPVAVKVLGGASCRSRASRTVPARSQDRGPVAASGDHRGA